MNIISPQPQTPFFIVGIGISEGGLDDLAVFFEKIPVATNMSFVVAGNLGIDDNNHLQTFLQDKTSMPVIETTIQMVAKPNTVYVMAPGTVLTVNQGILIPILRDQSYAMHFPVDMFFQSLANDQGENSIGIILAGKSSDGAKGIKAIKMAKGLTFAQSLGFPQYDAMPRNAIVSGAVDYILEMEDIIKKIALLSTNHLSSTQPIQSHEIFTNSPEELTKIYLLLKKGGGVKLEGYKEPTVYRRIFRRIQMHNLVNLLQYRTLLETDPNELEALRKDVLIGYTKFFRDTVFFNALTECVFPVLARNFSNDEPVRIWIAGCSTGEEAYSVVMSLVEFLEKNALDINIQVFATDVSATSIEKARASVYPQSITADVSPERLERFFVPVKKGYKINSQIREICLFAQQNILHDPYFSRIDLVICRNVLIYFDLSAQKKALFRFYQALSAEGILALGISESIGACSELFSLMDKKAKIYSKKSTDNLSTAKASFLKATEFDTDFQGIHLVDHRMKENSTMDHKIDYAILNRYGSVGVLVNVDLEVLQFRGNTGKYLEHLPGKASLNLMKMLRADLLFSVGVAINQSRTESIPIRKENIQYTKDNELYAVHIDVVPIQDQLHQEQYFAVLFSDCEASNEQNPHKNKFINKSIQLQKQELAVAQEYVQSVVEQYEGTNEKLRTAYEEIQSSNEELQTTNEELETIKEEAQSTNEELLASNEELQVRNDELATVTGDMQNLFRSINMTVIMLDKDLCIRRFNAGAERMFRLIPTDVGRPLTDIKPQFDLGTFEEDIYEVMETLIPVETEISGSDGRWYSLQIRPYRTSDNRIDGVVVLFFDISENNALKKSLKSAQDAYEYAAMILETIHEPFVILDHELQILSANHAFYEMFRIEPVPTQGKLIYDLGNGQWHSLALRDLLNDVINHNISLKKFQLEYSFSAKDLKVLEINARLFIGYDQTKRILLAVKCINGYKK